MLQELAVGGTMGGDRYNEMASAGRAIWASGAAMGRCDFAWRRGRTGRFYNRRFSTIKKSKGEVGLTAFRCAMVLSKGHL